jgi:hypothetical protein
MTTGGFSGVSFHSEYCPKGVACVLFKTTRTFGSRRPKLDHLTPDSIIERISYRCEDGLFPVFASCVAFSNPDLLSSSGRGPGYSWKKKLKRALIAIW